MNIGVPSITWNLGQEKGNGSLDKRRVETERDTGPSERGY